MDYTSLIKEVNIPQLVKALRMCMEKTCPFCDFYDGNGCKLGGYMKITLDAAAAIEELQAEVTELKRVNMELFDDLPKYGDKILHWVSMDEDKPKHDGKYITYNTDGFTYWNWWDKFGWAYSASDVLCWTKIDPPSPSGWVKSKCPKCGREMLTPAIVFDPDITRICQNCGTKMEVQS